MPPKKTDTRALRRIAEDTVTELAAEVRLPKSRRGDLVTSLVRQWLTYDGRAAFFLGSKQVELTLGRTPLGKTRVGKEWVQPRYTRLLRRDYKIALDERPELADQLNRGQSADVVSPEGLRLRLRVNPKEQKAGVERVNSGAAPNERPARPNYPRMAADLLDENLGKGLDAAELAELARSVVEQWQRFAGHAWVIVDARRLLVLTVSLEPDGLYHRRARNVAIDLTRALAEVGIATEDVAEIITRLNRVQPFEFRAPDGTRQRIWHDPKARRFWVQQLDAVPRQPRHISVPVLCPQCTAVLGRWREGERQQRCQFCGKAVTLP